jgi:hypothetical protein
MTISVVVMMMMMMRLWDFRYGGFDKVCESEIMFYRSQKLYCQTCHPATTALLSHQLYLFTILQDEVVCCPRIGRRGWRCRRASSPDH